MNYTMGNNDMLLLCLNPIEIIGEFGIKLAYQVTKCDPLLVNKSS